MEWRLVLYHRARCCSKACAALSALAHALEEADGRGRGHVERVYRAGHRHPHPSRRSGELLIVTKPGWGAGAVAALEDEGGIAPTGAQAPDPYPFLDGNKRIGSFLFLLYNRQEGIPGVISENTLTALALLIAESEPANKDLMIRLIVNLLMGEEK